VEAGWRFDTNGALWAAGPLILADVCGSDEVMRREQGSQWGVPIRIAEPYLWKSRLALGRFTVGP
jgi:hypothetical protein